MLFRLLFVLVTILSIQTSQASFAVKPNHALTPGKICTPTDADFYGYRYKEHIAFCTRDITVEEKQKVANQYGGIPQSQWSNYEFDHLIPLSIGGSNDSTNLWPQPIAEAKIKDKLEEQLYLQMSAGTITQAAAVKKINDWVAAH